MIKTQILVFLLRWLISGSFMWLAITFFATVSVETNFWFYATAGLVFSLVNSIVKPLATALALPLIILSMGVFTLILNVAMVALTIWLLPGVEMSIWGLIFTTIVMSVANGLVNFLLPSYNK